VIEDCFVCVWLWWCLKEVVFGSGGFLFLALVLVYMYEWFLVSLKYGIGDKRNI